MQFILTANPRQVSKANIKALKVTILNHRPTEPDLEHTYLAYACIFLLIIFSFALI